MPLVPVRPWRCVISGEPIPKGRPRFTKSGHSFTPKRTRDWEAMATAACKEASPQRFTGALRVSLLVVRSRPKRLLRKKDPDGLLWAPKRPDADNFAKATLDALQNAGVFVDDGQVVQLEVVKVYAERDGLPRIEVAVEEIDAVELARSLL